MPEPQFENSYAALPEDFYARVHPEKAPAPELIRLNETLAEQLGLDLEWLKSDAGVAMLSGGKLPEGAQPVAMAYAGHQFGGWVPQLGDGRAHLIGELLDSKGIRFDLHLKGSGRTPFSRRGDGKAALGPVLREYIVSEWFAAMGIPATRSLAVVTTGELVSRETHLPGAVLARVAQSHIRVGTFQYFAGRDDSHAIRTLADYMIERHFPELQHEDGRYLKMFKEIASRQARLIAQWMGVGFIHGVMNSDNMQLAGETIDFGPCAFMDAFRFDKVFSSIDRQGRYAWVRQPDIAQWNLARLAETVLPLFDANQEKAISMAEEALGEFVNLFKHHYTDLFSTKLGVREDASADHLVETALELMQEHHVDFTLFFRRLTQVANGSDKHLLLELFTDQVAAHRWLETWQQKWSTRTDKNADLKAMQQVNPIYIPRNHRIESVIKQAYQGDFKAFHQLVDTLQSPCNEQPDRPDYEAAPEAYEEVRQTFCGT